MTEASYQQARKLMSQLNHLRAVITKQKAVVARWTTIESKNIELGKSTEKVKQHAEKEISKLNRLKAKFASIKFPAHDISDENIGAKFCRICQTQIEKHLEYCLDCYQNQNLYKYDFKDSRDKKVSE